MEIEGKGSIKWLVIVVQLVTCKAFLVASISPVLPTLAAFWFPCHTVPAFPLEKSECYQFATNYVRVC